MKANYDNLTTVLEEGHDIQIYSYAIIENIIGAPIPPVYKNRKTFKHSNSSFQKAARKAGFELTHVDYEVGMLTFMKKDEQFVLPQAHRHARVCDEALDPNDLGKDLDTAIKAFKNGWDSTGGQYVPLLNKYNIIDEVYYRSGMEAYRAAMKRAIKFDGLRNSVRTRLREQSCSYLAERFKVLFDLQDLDFDKFTEWAKETATHIRSIYRNAGVNDYTYGNAQKLINVALKFVLSSNIVDYHHDVFKYCHFPVDGIIQNIIRKFFGIRPLTTCWSKNDNWDDFVRYQREVREAVLAQGYYSPMIWEATHWNF